MATLTSAVSQTEFNEFVAQQSAAPPLPDEQCQLIFGPDAVFRRVSTSYWMDA